MERSFATCQARSEWNPYGIKFGYPVQLLANHQCLPEPGQASGSVRPEPWLSCRVGARSISVCWQVSPTNESNVCLAWAMFKSASAVHDPRVQEYATLVYRAATAGKPQLHCRARDHVSDNCVAQLSEIYSCNILATYYLHHQPKSAHRRLRTKTRPSRSQKAC